MNIHLLLAQRASKYPGEHGPELLASADEYTMDVSPEWLAQKQEEAENSKEFCAINTMVISVPDDAVKNCLFPGSSVVQAEVLPDSSR